MDDTTEIKIVDSPPLNAIPSPHHLLKRIPSLTKVSSWTTEEAERINRTPLLNETEEKHDRWRSSDYSCLERVVIGFHKQERRLLHVAMKLLLHIQLISIFESIFFFMYVSSLEDNGIEKTMSTFINGAVNQCQNMTLSEIDFLNQYLGSYVNRTEINWAGDQSLANRTHWNQHIMDQSWFYVGGISGCFLLLVVYSKLRKIDIEWDAVLVENVIMVCLLAVYEIIFFNTIIFHYMPISSPEISKNAIGRMHDTCGLF